MRIANFDQDVESIMDYLHDKSCDAWFVNKIITVSRFSFEINNRFCLREDCYELNETVDAYYIFRDKEYEFYCQL